jgi:hypothetical protein
VLSSRTFPFRCSPGSRRTDVLIGKEPNKDDPNGCQSHPESKKSSPPIHLAQCPFRSAIIRFLDNLKPRLSVVPAVFLGRHMSRTLQSPRHEALRAFLVEKRKKAGLTQAEVAKSLRRHQSFVATVERGQRRIDVVELLDFAAAIGFDPHAAIRKIMKS